MPYTEEGGSVSVRVLSMAAGLKGGTQQVRTDIETKKEES